MSLDGCQATLTAEKSDSVDTWVNTGRHDQANVGATCWLGRHIGRQRWFQSRDTRANRCWADICRVVSAHVDPCVQALNVATCYPTPVVGDAWERVISCVCDCVCVSVCHSYVCPCSDRKTARAINNELVQMYSTASAILSNKMRLKGQGHVVTKSVMVARSLVNCEVCCCCCRRGMHVDRIARVCFSVACRVASSSTAGGELLRQTVDSSIGERQKQGGGSVIS